MPVETCSVSVVVPTRNEAANVGPLVARLAETLKDVEGGWELLFVDDSDDGTPGAVDALAGHGWPVGLLHRPPGARPGGLGGAVQAGFARVKGTVIVVMDADLQHPPEVVPALVAPVLAGAAALVAGSRYVWAGGADGLSGPWRHVVSRSCRLLVHVLVPPSRALQDPLGGLFALHRSLLDGVDLRPEGYKILLEVVVRARPARVGNVGFDFAPRHSGSSKATAREGMLFFKHLARLVVAARRAGPGRPVAQVPLAS